MARANRHFLPNRVWHITHRCHNRDFLLSAAKDRRRWLYWLFQARRRYGLSVLNYTVTCNHIHLLVVDQGRGEIPCSMQLVAGRLAQEYNRRMNRRGAFWQDRYHATAIETDEHLLRCMVYIDLNMVRAGAVEHPGDWRECGFYEIQNPRKRGRRIDYRTLQHLTHTADLEDLQFKHRRWVSTDIEVGELNREDQWTRKRVVGAAEFERNFKQSLTTMKPAPQLTLVPKRYNT